MSIVTKLAFILRPECATMQFAKQRAAWEQRWTVLRTMTLEVFPGMSQPEEGAQPEQKHPLFEGAIALEMDATTLGAMPAPPNGGRGFLLKLDVDGVVSVRPHPPNRNICKGRAPETVTGNKCALSSHGGAALHGWTIFHNHL